MELPKMVWMMVDLNNKELPLKIADSPEELAALCGTTRSNVESAASKSRRGKKTRYVKVWIADV